MIDQLALHRLLFFDIETVSISATFNELSENMQALWERKHLHLSQEGQSMEESFENRAAIFAEFGKIICISCGFFVGDEFRIKSFYGDDESSILQDFGRLLSDTNYILCGHNIKEFDVPYLCRRMLVHGITLPNVLNIAGKKPWEVQFVDTMQLWKFGDFKHYTALNLLAEIFNIPTPKDDIDGSQVGEVYWKNKDLERIKLYCEKDVVSVARLIQRWKGTNILKDADIIHIT